MSCVLNAVRSDGRKDGQATSCHGKDLEGELLSLSTIHSISIPYHFIHPHQPAKTLHSDSPRSVSQDFSDSQDKAQGQRDEKTQRSESEIWWATFFWALGFVACVCLQTNVLRWFEMTFVESFLRLLMMSASHFFWFVFDVSKNQRISIHSTHNLAPGRLKLDRTNELLQANGEVERMWRKDHVFRFFWML